MELSSGQILYISVLICLFLILKIVIIMKNKIASFSDDYYTYFSYFLYCFRNIIDRKKINIFI